MAKDTKGLCLIAIGEVFFHLISHSIVLQLQRLFQEHLSPHEFGGLTPGGYETIPFDIKALFNLHLNWVMMQSTLKTLLIMFIELLFLESYEMSKDFWQTLSPLPCCFMVLIFLFTTSMTTWGGGHRYWIIFKHEVKWTLGGLLFALAHYRTLLKIVA
jgi:hypothetical protein